MVYTLKWLWRPNRKFLLLFLYLLICSQESKADHPIHDSSITSSEEVRRTESDVSSVNGSDSGRTKREESTQQFDYIYKTLYERGLHKMCSIMRNADQRELNQSLGRDFTILAPSDEAFSLIPGSQFEELKNDKQKRKEFIAQHIIPSRLALRNFRAFDEREVKNANGLTLHVTAYPNGFVINGANVVEGDIPTENPNNLIQVIDKVLYPQKPYNLLEVLEANPHLTQISSFLSLSGLQKELTTNDSFTFFAPNDEAFRAVPWPVTQQMLSNNTFLRLLIANHVIPGKHYSSGLAGNNLYSIGGNVLNFTGRKVQSHSLVLVNLVPILESDLIATNGVIHVITRIMLPKDLMEDCNCLTKPKPTQSLPNTTLSNDTFTTLDPLIREMLGTDQNLNSVDRRYGSLPRIAAQNGDHFTSTPKPVSFKSFWDDIFASPADQTNGTQPPAQSTSTKPLSNVTQTGHYNDRSRSTLSGLEPNRSTSNPNTTDLPFIWDILTTETSRPNQTTIQTSDRFTLKPTIRVNTSRSAEALSRIRQFTAGVVYDDELNGTTTSALSSETASTGGPSAWTRPFYRPGDKRNVTETTVPNNTSPSEPTLAIGSSYFRPTLKPLFRPTTVRDTFESNAVSNGTVPPYDRRYGAQRERIQTNNTVNPFDRSRIGAQRAMEPIEQYIEQEIEPQYSANRSQYPHRSDPKDSVPQGYGRPHLQPQPYPQRPQHTIYTPPPNAQPVPQSQYNGSQPLLRRQMRPTSDSPRNDSRFSPEEGIHELEQKPYSPTSWSHQTNRTASVSRRQPSYPPRVAHQTYHREPGRAQLNWWDSRYEALDPMPVRAYPLPQHPKRPISDSRSPIQSTHTSAERPRVFTPGVVYDTDRSGQQYYRPPAKDGLRRPYYQQNETKSRPHSSAYPQTPYRKPQPFIESPKRSQIPSRDLYLRPEIVDRTYVPSYDPYIRVPPAPQVVVGEYPYMYNIDHSYYSGDQSRVPVRDQKAYPYDRRRPPSATKAHYDSIRRRGDKPFRRPENESPISRPEANGSDLKTISEIIESPDLMIGGKFKHFTTLKDMINDSGLWEALNKSTTSITMFMPTDDAFDNITDGSVEQMKRNPKLMRDFLTQHIMGYSLSPQDLKNNMRVKSLNGEMHLINIIDGGKILVDGNEVIAATLAKNGNVYVLDQVLDRGGRKSRSIVDELRKRSDLSTFSSLMQRSNLMKKLSEDSGPFTLLAPNNEALRKVNLRELIRDQNGLNEFIEKHVMDGAVYSSLLPDPIESAFADHSSDIRRVGLSPDSSDATKLLSADITTENGVIHIIDSVLPQKLNLTEKSENYATDESNGSAKQSSLSLSAQNLGIKRFTNWLNKSGLIDELVKDGRQYTLLVPTDRAVGKLPLKLQSILNSEPSRLNTLLEYHIIPGFVDTKTLNDNEILTTINNKQIRFNRLDGGRVLTFSGSPLNKETTEKNLLIISVDNVLYPPQGSVRDIIGKSPLLKTLNEIIRTAQMEDELRNSSEITLFAPKDEAFKQLDAELLQRLKTDQNYSREFLKKHIIPKVMFTSALQTSSDANNMHKEQALNGETLKVYRKPNCVSVNGIILSFADITATNGVLHIIDHII